jgi:hypothetical protein
MLLVGAKGGLFLVSGDAVEPHPVFLPWDTSSNRLFSPSRHDVGPDF